MDKSLISLMRSHAYIDGAWVGTPSCPVIDKATGEELTKVPALGAKEARVAIEAANGRPSCWCGAQAI